MQCFIYTYSILYIYFKNLLFFEIKENVDEIIYCILSYLFYNDLIFYQSHFYMYNEIVIRM